MRTVDFYFSGPSESDSVLPYAPDARTWHEDFYEIAKLSGYNIKTCAFHTTVKQTGNTVIAIVEGWKL